MGEFFNQLWDSFIWHHATDLIVLAILVTLFALWVAIAFGIHVYKRLKFKWYMWKKHGIDL